MVPPYGGILIGESPSGIRPFLPKPALPVKAITNGHCAESTKVNLRRNTAIAYFALRGLILEGHAATQATIQTIIINNILLKIIRTGVEFRQPVWHTNRIATRR